ncbi:barstar family protein [Streptomyces flavofungini]|uniref:barstar family protein n=1 Tax=Streptomyces flavofungini TaxID=68200 RepID=UPI0034DE25B8
MNGGTGGGAGPLAPVLGAAREAGWGVTVLSLTGVTDKAAFMERCAEAFGLPEWFGRNWDALADCLSDFSWAPEVTGRCVVVSGWQEYARAAPGEWETAQEVFSDAVAHGRDGAHPALEILLALGPGPAPLPATQRAGA